MGKRVKLEIETGASDDRVRLWKRTLDENFVGVECLAAGDDLRVSLDSLATEKGTTTRARFTRQTLARPLRLVEKANEERLLLAVVRSGGHAIVQGAQEATLDKGDLYILDEARPFEAHFTSDTIEQCTLHFPKALLTQRVGPFEQLAFGSEAPLQKLVATIVNGIADALDQVDDETANQLLDQALDLVALMIAGRTGSRIEPSTHRAGTLRRLKSYVHAHLRDEDLTLDRAARALGISPRYVNALLASEGTSFGRYLLAERLEGARREIMDPRHVHRQVTEVAFDWGFRNASHFGRKFKGRYGMSPRDAKPRAPS